VCAPSHGDLIFHCAIGAGLVLAIAKEMSLAENQQTSLAQWEQDVGPLASILNCDTILHLLEIALLT
jgi:hypothetical protein